MDFLTRDFFAMDGEDKKAWISLQTNTGGDSFMGNRTNALKGIFKLSSFYNWMTGLIETLNPPLRQLQRVEVKVNNYNRKGVK